MPSTSPTAVDVYSDILAHCQRYAFSPRFEFLGEPSDAWRLPDDIARLHQSLAEKFPAEVLAAAGIVDLSSTGLQLLKGQPFIALRNARGEVVDLLFGSGCLSRMLPILAALRDSYTLKLRGKVLLLAPTIDDVILLRQCGLPATVNADFESLGPTNLDDFCIALGARYRRQRANGGPLKPQGTDTSPPAQAISPWPSVGPRGLTPPPFQPSAPGAVPQHPPESKQAKRWEPERVIGLAFSLSEPGLDGKAALAGVAAHVEDLEMAYSLEHHEICYCELSPAALRKLTAGMRFQDPKVLKDALCEALEEHADWEELNRRPRPPNTLGSTFMALLAADPGDEDRKLALYQRQLRADVVAPLLDLRADDPLELQLLHLQAAQLVELSAAHCVHVTRRLERVQPRHLAPEDPVFAMHDLNATLALNAQMLKVCAAMSRMRNLR